MSAFFSDLCRILLNPGVVFARMAAHISFDTALGLLLLCALLLGITSFYGERMRAMIRQFAIHTEHLLHNCAAFAGIATACWLLATLPSLEILRLLGVKTGFEAVFSVLVLASLPRLLAWIAFPLRNWRREAYWGWRILTLGALGWTTWLLWLGFQALAPAPAWKLFCAALLPVAALWVEGFFEIRSQPESLVSACFWRRAAGERVVVFYPRLKSPVDRHQIVRECDRTLMELTMLLEVKPLPFKVYVFLFGNLDLHRRCIEETGTHCSGYAHKDSISLTDCRPWDKIGATVVHEFCHVLREQRIAKDLRGLLDEGLACYSESQILVYQAIPLTADRSALRMPIPLRILARRDVFYDWYDAAEADCTAQDYYQHAHAFVRYLIERAGLGPFKELCRIVQKDPDGNPGERLAKGIQEVYGVSIKEMEAQWRQALEAREGNSRSDPPEDADKMQEPFLHLYGWGTFTDWARRAIRRAAREAAGLHHSRISTEHLLLGLAGEPDGSGVVRLFEKQGVSARRIYQETRWHAPRGDALSGEPDALTPDARRAIEDACREARQMGSDYIGTEHMLLGLLQNEESLAGQMLARQGLTLDVVRSAILAGQDRIA